MPCLSRTTLKSIRKRSRRPGSRRGRQQLRLLDRRRCVHRFHLHDHNAVHHQIDAIPGLERHGLIDDGKRRLTENRIASALQFVREANFGGRLQQPRPERPMHRDGGADSGAPDPCSPARARALCASLEFFVFPFASTLSTTRRSE